MKILKYVVTAIFSAALGYGIASIKTAPLSHSYSDHGEQFTAFVITQMSATGGTVDAKVVSNAVSCMLPALGPSLDVLGCPYKGSVEASLSQCQSQGALMIAGITWEHCLAKATMETL